MTTQHLVGRVDQAFGHMTLLGLAAIAESQGISECAVSWTDEMTPRPAFTFAGTWEDVCDAVLRHARSVTESGSWMHQLISFKTDSNPDSSATPDQAGKSGKKKSDGFSLFSPRVKAISSDADWQAYEDRRMAVIDELENEQDALSLRLIGSLGRPAYWGRESAKTIKQDDGASRWEMKTRNKGEEFVSNRLVHLGQWLAGREPNQVSSALLGQTELDEKGKTPAHDSRLGTGLQAPGRADAIAAWCALWGISQFEVAQRLRHVSATAGYSVRPQNPIRTRAAGGVFYLPIFTQPTGLAKYRVVSNSSHLLQAAQQILDTQTDPTIVAAQSVHWLRDKNVAAIATFPMHITGNLSAPERWAKTGEIHSIRGES